jgi:uncharacterized protein YciI
MDMLIAILKYTRPLAEVDAILPAHRVYLNSLLAEGILLICGKQNPRTGGVIIAKNITRAEFEKSLSSDPLSKVYEYQIIEFIPTLYDECLKDIVSK